ncbi:unnamed protein product [Aphanomyces euteiches]|nr:hypothetical protein Ae201684P_003484 [Aphanomyces euteiches]
MKGLHNMRDKRKRQANVYASSSESELDEDAFANHLLNGAALSRKKFRRRNDDDKLYLHIQNGQGLSAAIPRRPKTIDRGLKSIHLWKSEYPPWLLKVDSETVSLSDEMTHLATYLSVKPQEKEARETIVEAITTTLEKSFGADEFQVHLFGSHAKSTSVATFRSDVDMTIEQNSTNNRTTYFASDLYDDDDDQSGDSAETEDNDTSGMQFNFTVGSTTPSNQSTASATTPSTTTDTMSKTKRNQCVRFLHKAARYLRQDHPSYTVEVRRWAKVPIINVVDKISKIEVDVSLGKEKPTAGDEIVAYYAGTYPIFNILVVLLKEFLYENSINKPYEGGIGSFRLYCMVTHLLATSHPSNISNGPRLLLRFFELYGCSQKFNNKTVLKLRHPKRQPPLQTEVDFQTIFRIRDCNFAFHDASKRLSSAMQATPREKSVLSSVFWTRDLREDRDERLALATKAKPQLEIAIDTTIATTAPKVPQIDKRFGKKRITTSTKKLKKLLKLKGVKA